MTSVIARIAALFVAFAAALLLSGCTPSTESDGHTDHTHSAGGDSAEHGPHNAADIAFAQNMLPHHKQALELVDLARANSTDPALLELAAAIADAQGPEIGQMSEMLRSWGQNPDAAMDHSGHDMAAMPGMVDNATMQRLGSLRGAEFDTLWLESMISHHEGAVDMAKTELADGENAEAKELAEHVISTQEAEITQMKQMLEG